MIMLLQSTEAIDVISKLFSKFEMRSGARPCCLLTINTNVFCEGLQSVRADLTNGDVLLNCFVDNLVFKQRLALRQCQKLCNSHPIFKSKLAKWYTIVNNITRFSRTGSKFDELGLRKAGICSYL